jgi:hypothetical protein
MTFELEIVRESLGVFSQSIMPAIKMTISYKLNPDMIPLNISGSVYTEDNKFIAVLTQLPPVDKINNMGGHTYESGHSSVITHLSKGPDNRKFPHTHDMMFTLDKKLLDYIEERRHLKS